MRSDLEAVRNAVSKLCRNGPAEGLITRLKALKHAMDGRVGIQLLRGRMFPLQIASWHGKRRRVDLRHTDVRHCQDPKITLRNRRSENVK
jgi:hypothetical protein